MTRSSQRPTAKAYSRMTPDARKRVRGAKLAKATEPLRTPVRERGCSGART